MGNKGGKDMLESEKYYYKEEKEELIKMKK